jgi:hypothetical protein
MKTKLLLFLFFITVISYSQEFKKTATSGFVFLELPVTARTAALGEASISLSDLNASGLFINPASTGFTNLTHSFSASYSPWIADIKHYASSYTFKTDFGVLGIGLIAVDYGSMPRVKKTSGQRVYQVEGTFNSSAIALQLGYSRMLTDNFSYGVSLKYVQETIDVYSASNFLFDGGILYYTGLGSLRLAAVFQNFGVESKFINDPFKMPAVIKLGLSAEVLGDNSSEYRLTTIVEALHPNDGDEKLNAGLELAWRNIITLRGGYKFFYDEETYSLGVGFNPNLDVPAQIDFAYSDYNRLGKILRFTLHLGLL